MTCSSSNVHVLTILRASHVDFVACISIVSSTGYRRCLVMRKRKASGTRQSGFFLVSSRRQQYYRGSNSGDVESHRRDVLYDYPEYAQTQTD